MMKDREEDLSFVKTVVQSNDFQSLMHIHNVIKHGSVHTEDPVTKNSVAMSHIVSNNMIHYNSVIQQRILANANLVRCLHHLFLHHVQDQS